MGVPTGLVLAIRQKFQSNCFVETGTYQGATAVWAGSVFPQVFTIEGSEELHAQALAKFSRFTNIQFLRGESPAVLKQIAPSIPDRAIYWLDAHWSGGITHGQESECPLLEEIRVIDSRPSNPFILIDDARLFLAPPPLPHKADQWPDIATIVETLRAKDKSRYIVIVEDLIIAVPAAARDLVIQYARQSNAA
jgi:hypothetical protein